MDRLRRRLTTVNRRGIWQIENQWPFWGRIVRGVTPEKRRPGVDTSGNKVVNCGWMRRERLVRGIENGRKALRRVHDRGPTDVDG